MFTQTQTLDDASGDDIVYTLVSQSEDGTRRLDTASSLAFPGLFAIKHSVQGAGAAAIDRHLVSFSKTLAGATASRTCTANFTLAVPRDSVVTNQVVYDLVANLIDFLVDGGLATPMGTTALASLLRGES